jgi:hypothetical protein
MHYEMYDVAYNSLLSGWHDKKIFYLWIVLTTVVNIRLAILCWWTLLYAQTLKCCFRPTTTVQGDYLTVCRKSFCRSGGMHTYSSRKFIERVRTYVIVDRLRGLYTLQFPSNIAPLNLWTLTMKRTYVTVLNIQRIELVLASKWHVRVPQGNKCSCAMPEWKERKKFQYTFQGCPQVNILFGWQELVRNNMHYFRHLLCSGCKVFMICWPMGLSVALQARMGGVKETREAGVLPAEPTERFMAGSQILSMYLLLRYLSLLCVCLCPFILQKFLRQSQRRFTTGSLPPTSLSWWQAPWDPWPVIFFQLNTCGYSPYVTSSLTRGWVCCLQLLLALASAVIIGSESHNIRYTPTWRARSLYLYPPETGWPSYTPRHWVPFSSPPTTCRATVEVFDPASTEGQLH